MENKKTLTFLFNNKEKYEIDIDNKNLKLVYQCSKNPIKGLLNFKGCFKSSDINKLFEIQNKISEFNDLILNESDKYIESISFEIFEIYNRLEYPIINIISNISNKSILQNKDDDPLSYPILNLEIIGGK